MPLSIPWCACGCVVVLLSILVSFDPGGYLNTLCLEMYSQIARIFSYTHGILLHFSETDQLSQMVRRTWENPANAMAILLFIGGDIVGMALAQLSGPYIVPVAFSFGWIGYSFNMLMSVVGSCHLMPPPDYDAKLINVENEFEQDNRSWILGRLLRDFDRPFDNSTGLCVTIFKASAESAAGLPERDWCWGSGIIIIFLQLIIAAIPLIQDGDWNIFFITYTGTALALLTGALPQWRLEKWACRRNSSKTVCLTGGNGTRNVMAIIGNGVGLDLEDLAAMKSPRLSRYQGKDTNHLFMGLPLAFRITQLSCIVLPVLWITLLITVIGLRQNTWFLLLVGGLGMGQNVVVAGARRKHSASGIHLERVAVFQRQRSMQTLMDVDSDPDFQDIGRALLKVFFPEKDSLRPSETKWWNGEKEEYEKQRAGKRSTPAGSVTPEKSERLGYPQTSSVISHKIEHSNKAPVSPRVTTESQTSSPTIPIINIVDLPQPQIPFAFSAVNDKNQPRQDIPKSILSIPVSNISDDVVDPGCHATPCRLRFLDVNAFLDTHDLRILEYPAPEAEHSVDGLSSIHIPPYAAISYPWRDLQLPEGQSTTSISIAGALHSDPISVSIIHTACIAARAYDCHLLWLDRLCIVQSCKKDKIWQIQRMFQIYKNCATCIVFPGGLVRLAKLDDTTLWTDRAWTLQEAAAPGAKKVKIVFQLSYTSYSSYIQDRCEAEKYNKVFREKWSNMARLIKNYGSYGPFVDKILEVDRSATCDFERLSFHLGVLDSTTQSFAPDLAQDHDRFPIRIIRVDAIRLLRSAIRMRGLDLWTAAYTRSSKRAVDMVFSLMDLFGVRLDVSQFHDEAERMKATIAMIQLIMKASPKATATWLFIAPRMPPSKELSTLPQMPETSESGRAYIHTGQKGRVLAYDAIEAGGARKWKTEGAPRGEMTDSGYFVFWSRAALLVEEGIEVSRWKDYNNCEIWAIIVGRLKELNRNPDTWRIQLTDFNSPKPEGVYELTLMFVESHGYGLYHRIGMEREIDERKTAGWNWMYRCFQVGGPGRGERKRFGTSVAGPVFKMDYWM